MIDDGQGRQRVMINKGSFTHPLESDGCTILNVLHASVKTYPLLDDDGGTKELANGQEACRTNLVLCGESANDEGEVIE